METNPRTYSRTHPWLKFEADFSRAPVELWVMLGECQSKCEHLAGMPLRPDVATQLYQVYLAKGVHSTTAIEGNTLTEEEVLAQVKGELEVPPSRAYLQKEVENMISAYKQVAEQILKPTDAAPLSVEEIKSFNRLVLRDIPMPEGGRAGEVSPHRVVVGRYLGAPREDCEYLLAQLCEWLATDWTGGRPELHAGMTLLKAILAHLYLAWIHPFADGNGRTARLMEFRILLGGGVPAPAAHLLSNHYNLTRAEYYRQLSAASASGGDIVPFAVYAVQGFRDGLREQIEQVRSQQFDVIWRNYVHEQFRDKNRPSDQRQLRLVLDLSRQKSPVPANLLTQISTRVTGLYAARTEKTLQRDVEALVKRNLLRWSPAGYTANVDIIRAFLPPVGMTSIIRRDRPSQ